MKATHQYQFDVVLRTETNSRWEKFNPIFRPGELIACKTSEGYKFKLGDGVTPYKNLPFIPLGEGIDKGCVFTSYAGGMAELSLGPLAKYNSVEEEPPDISLEEFSSVLHNSEK
ncbi:MAG: hypothetical protein J6D42_11510 [Clostridia bacterium]|nr:hypothetical protein [Clostridia bacterium]